MGLGVDAFAEHLAAAFDVGDGAAPPDPGFGEDQGHERVPLDVGRREQVAYDPGRLVCRVACPHTMTTGELVAWLKVRMPLRMAWSAGQR
jgi:hypothetical protein